MTMQQKFVALRYGLDSSGSREGPMAGSCEHGNEPSSSVKSRQSLYYLSGLLASQEGLYSMKLVS